MREHICKKYRIAMVIKTEGLEYDDRVRKEITSIQRILPNVSFKIFVMLPDNKEQEGITSYGVPYSAVCLKSRENGVRGTNLVKKAYDFFIAAKDEIKCYDAVWLGDFHTVFFALFLRHKHILWDLHELPEVLTGSFIKRCLLRHAFNRCKLILHANEQRIDYLKSIKAISNNESHIAIRNYPNFEDIDSNYDSNYYKFKQWKGDRKCAYIQGVWSDSRAPLESLSSLLSFPDLCAVVVGGFEPQIKQQLYNQYGVEFEKRVFFVGKIPQMKIPQYIQLCDLSLIFYKNTTPNNYYCEANRFYQAIVLGLPVVVGNNPSMKSIVDKYGFGIVADTDGSDVSEITKAIKILFDKKGTLYENNRKYYTYLSWVSQDPILKEVTLQLLGVD